MTTLINELLRFLSASPTPFHAVQNLTTMLEEAGFTALNERDAWELEKGRRYYCTRENSSIVAFCVGTKAPEHEGFHIVGAHTDSPCLKVKPQPEVRKAGCMQLGVEVYGGALLNPWFDRDLSLAGRISFVNQEDQLEEKLTGQGR